MPGGWTISMTWMRMPGQSWVVTAAAFIGMWMVMVVAMMMPSLVLALWRYREAVCRVDEKRLAGLTAMAGLGYFSVWAVIGVAVFALGVALARVEMDLPGLARTVSLAAGLVVLIAGTLQFTSWKAHHITCWRMRPEHDCALPRECRYILAAWPAPRHSLQLWLCGAHCGSPHDRRHGPEGDGICYGSHHRRTACTDRRTRGPNCRSGRFRDGITVDRSCGAGIVATCEHKR
jgi:hypothetical protein